jgi:hypothetical protein
VRKSARITFAAATLTLNERTATSRWARRRRFGLFLGWILFVGLGRVSSFRTGAAATRAGGRASTGAAVGRVTHSFFFVLFKSLTMIKKNFFNKWEGLKFVVK